MGASSHAAAARYGTIGPLLSGLPTGLVARAAAAAVAAGSRGISGTARPAERHRACPVPRAGHLRDVHRRRCICGSIATLGRARAGAAAELGRAARRQRPRRAADSAPSASVVVSWSGRDSEPAFEGDPTIVGEAASPAGRSPSAPGCGRGRDGARGALETLRERGEGFHLTLAHAAPALRRGRGPYRQRARAPAPARRDRRPARAPAR